MKIYLEKGHGMAASMRMDPYKVETTQDGEPMPEALRAYHVILYGTGDEVLTMYGSVKELRAAIAGMARALATIEEKEAE